LAELGFAISNASGPAKNLKKTMELKSGLRMLALAFFNIDVESCHACGARNVKIVAAISGTFTKNRF